jgi:hypothetical protein
MAGLPGEVRREEGGFLRGADIAELAGREEAAEVAAGVAGEALRDTWRQRRATMDELWKAAAACRVQRVIEPYMESLV